MRAPTETAARQDKNEVGRCLPIALSRLAIGRSRSKRKPLTTEGTELTEKMQHGKSMPGKRRTLEFGKDSVSVPQC